MDAETKVYNIRWSPEEGVVSAVPVYEVPATLTPSYPGGRRRPELEVAPTPPMPAPRRLQLERDTLPGVTMPRPPPPPRRTVEVPAIEQPVELPDSLRLLMAKAAVASVVVGAIGGAVARLLI